MNELFPIGSKVRRNLPGLDHHDTGMYHGRVYTVSAHVGAHLEFEETIRHEGLGGRGGGRWSPGYFELVSLPGEITTEWWRES